MTDPILVTGCARSGTSLTAGIISRCGAFGGDTAGPTTNNKRGMYENTDIRNGIIKPYLRSIGADPRCQKPLPKMADVLATCKDVDYIHSWNNRIRKVMKKHGYKGGPWYYKGAKMCLMWPLWRYAFPTAKWVIVRRKKEDIVNSCLKTGFMSAYQNKEGWGNWVDTHLIRFEEMKSFGLNIFEIWPQDMISGDLVDIRLCIKEFLGLEWNEKEVLNFISPALWSNAKRKEKCQGQQLQK
jgi:hypothetical protein